MPPVPPPLLTLTEVAPVRLTPVSTTVSVVPLWPVAGAIENSPAGGTNTVKVTSLLVLVTVAGVTGGFVVVVVVTLTFLAPGAAVELMKKVALIWVSLTTEKVTGAAIPFPETLTAVVLSKKPEPVSVTPIWLGVPGTPRIPDAEPVHGNAGVPAGHAAIEVSTGPVTVNGNVLLWPPASATAMFTVPMGVVEVLWKVAVMLVGVIAPTVTENPATGGLTTTVAPAAKFVPAKVTGTFEPRTPVLGVMDVSVGGGAVDAAVTVNVTGPSVAAPTVTVTFLAVADAPDEMVKVAVTVVALTAAKLLTVMPPPDTLTAVAPVRPVPVMVTFTTVPWAPVLGAIEFRPPWAPLFWNSTAPISKWVVLPGSGRGFPKKSVLSCGIVPTGRVVVVIGTTSMAGEPAFRA